MDMNRVYILLNELEGKLFSDTSNFDAKLKKLRSTAWLHFEKLGTLTSDEYHYVNRRVARLRKLLKILRTETQW